MLRISRTLSEIDHSSSLMSPSKKVEESMGKYLEKSIIIHDYDFSLQKKLLWKLERF